MASDMLWKIQSALHRNQAALPGALLLLSSAVLLYQHTKEDDFYPMRTWLTLILATMLPLAYLDMKIPACSDPLGLLCKFGPKVLLMHFFFLLLRLRLLLHSDTLLLNATNVGGLAAMSLALCCGFGAHRWTGSNLAEHLDVVFVVVLATVVTICTELASELFSIASHVDNLRSDMIPEFFETLLVSLSNYAEILSFVPAVNTALRSEKKADAPAELDSDLCKRMAWAFVLALGGFYFVEDAVTACLMLFELPLRAVAHLLHFLLLVDFSVYFLACAYNPERSGKGTFLMRSFEACGV